MHVDEITAKTGELHGGGVYAVLQFPSNFTLALNYQNNIYF